MEKYQDNQILENKSILKKIEEVKQLQKEFVKSAFLDKKIEEQIKEKEQELEKIPLYVIYLKKEEELNEILTLIKDGLSDHFQSLLMK